MKSFVLLVISSVLIATVAEAQVTLKLLDAGTGEEVTTLLPDTPAIVNEGEIAGRKIAVVAETSACELRQRVRHRRNRSRKKNRNNGLLQCGAVKRMIFVAKGATKKRQREKFLPYSLFGDRPARRAQGFTMHNRKLRGKKLKRGVTTIKLRVRGKPSARFNFSFEVSSTKPSTPNPSAPGEDTPQQPGDTPSTPDPMFDQYQRWSNPATWPTGKVPAPGDMVMIPQGKSILLDVPSVEVKSIMVHGALAFDERDISLTTDFIHLHGGKLFIGTEANPYHHRAVITLVDPRQPDFSDRTKGAGDAHKGGFKSLAVMAGGLLEVHGASGRKVSWTVLSQHAPPGAAAISLAQPVDWQVGDEIVITPSGYLPEEAEVRTVTGVEGAVVSLDRPLDFLHTATVEEHAGRTIDMRAEVGLLSRNVVLQGDAASEENGFGAHVIILGNHHHGGGEEMAMAHHQTKVKLEGLELRRVGQRGFQGRYPIHWHHAGNIEQHYVRGVTVRDSFQRAMVVHGSHGVLAENNVVYNVRNHAIVFSEDGDEYDNSFVGNLVVGVRGPAKEEMAFIGSKKDPIAPCGFRAKPGGPREVNQCQFEDRSSCFWGENPFNHLVGNRCAGVDNGNGYFFTNAYSMRFKWDEQKAKYVKKEWGERVDLAGTRPGTGVTTTFRDNVAHTIFGNCALGKFNYAPKLPRAGIFVLVAPELLTLEDTLVYASSCYGAWVEEKVKLKNNNFVSTLFGATHISTGGIFEGNLYVGESGNPATIGGFGHLVTESGPELQDRLDL